MIRSTMMAAVLLTASCGNNGTPTQGMPVSAGCQIFLNGAVTASTDQICTVEATNSAPDAGVSFVISAAGASYGTLSCNALLAGPTLTTGTFGTSGASAVLQATTKLSSSMSQGWDQSIHASTPDTGTISLAVSAIGTPAKSKEETTWSGCHGILAATMTPAVASDAGSVVTARVIF
jgi:hypothetical protein